MSDVLDLPKPTWTPGPDVSVTWRRVGLVDLNLHWLWLSDRLAKRYPLSNERERRGFLLGCMNDNDAYFVCNEHAIALFNIVRLPFQHPHVQEQFCLADDAANAGSAAALYGPVGTWIRRLGIRDFYYAYFSDAAAFEARREAQALSGKDQPRKCMIMADHRGG